MSVINTETMTYNATMKLMALDKTFVGSEDYLGLEYFWAYEYRYPMRDATARERRKVHAAFLKAGLPLDGESPEHAAIIKRYVEWNRLGYGPKAALHFGREG